MSADVTLCLLVKDEERSIEENIAYNLLLGFDKILIYNNASSDATTSIIKSIMEIEPRVTQVLWPDVPGIRPQHSAYQDALAKCETEWIAFFDADEFLVLRDLDNIQNLLLSYPSDVSAIAINWLLFGSSGHSDAYEDLVINRFQRRAPLDYGKNRFFKSIVKTSRAETMHAHAADLRTGCYINPLGDTVTIENKCKTLHVCGEIAVLHHYSVKSKEEFLEKKRRGSSARSISERDKFVHIDESANFWEAHDTNNVEDRTAVKSGAAVQVIIKAWRQSRQSKQLDQEQPHER